MQIWNKNGTETVFLPVLLGSGLPYAGLLTNMQELVLVWAQCTSIASEKEKLQPIYFLRTTTRYIHLFSSPWRYLYIEATLWDE